MVSPLLFYSISCMASDTLFTSKRRKKLLSWLLRCFSFMSIVLVAIVVNWITWSIWIAPVFASKYRIVLETRRNCSNIYAYTVRQLLLPRSAGKNWMGIYICHGVTLVSVNQCCSALTGIRRKPNMLQDGSCRYVAQDPSYGWQTYKPNDWVYYPQQSCKEWSSY